MKRIYFIIILLVCSLHSEFYGQQVIEIEPLFEYPVAPENIESLQEKCDYIVKNFWDNFDFKNKKSVDQYALNSAFQVYATSFRFASMKEINTSIEKLLKNISGNPTLFMQFMKAAEENLYGPRADYWSDDIYLKFLDALSKNKKVPEARKKRYLNQAKAIKDSKEGMTAPTFWFTDKERASKQYFPMSTPTLLIFGNPDDTDWRLARLKLDSNFKLSEALQKGKINILYILPVEVKGWQNLVSNYNTYWTVGVSEDVNNIYDVRMNPSIYVVGADGKIAKKNIYIEDAVDLLLQQVN